MKALVVGVGRIGSAFDQIKEKGWVNSHVGAYKSNKKIRGIALCDQNESALKEAADFWSIKDTFYDLEDALNGFSPDIVSLCVGAKHNLELVENIVKHESVRFLWVEKPFSDKLGNALRQEKLLKNHGIHFVTNYQRRFDDFYLHLRSRLQSLVGNVQRCAAYFSGGALNSGSHLINLLIFYFGIPKKAVPLKLKIVPDKEPHGDFCLEFKDFSAYCFELNRQSSIISGGYSIFEIQIFGDNGRVDIKGLPFNEYEFDYYIAGKSRFKKIKILRKKELQLHFQRKYMERELSFLLSKKNKEKIGDTEGAIDTLKVFKKLGILQ